MRSHQRPEMMRSLGVVSETEIALRLGGSDENRREPSLASWYRSSLSALYGTESEERTPLSSSEPGARRVPNPKGVKREMRTPLLAYIAH